MVQRWSPEVIERLVDPFCPGLAHHHATVPSSQHLEPNAAAGWPTDRIWGALGWL